MQRQIRLNSEAADILARGGKDGTREGSSSCSSGDSMYQTDFSSNLTTNTTGNSSTGEVSSSPESVSKEKLLETSEDDALETSQDLVQTNFQKKIWNSSQDHVNPPSLSRGSSGSSHVVRIFFTAFWSHFRLLSGVERVPAKACKPARLPVWEDCRPVCLLHSVGFILISKNSIFHRIIFSCWRVRDSDDLCV